MIEAEPFEYCVIPLNGPFSYHCVNTENKREI